MLKGKIYAFKVKPTLKHLRSLCYVKRRTVRSIFNKTVMNDLYSILNRNSQYRSAENGSVLYCFFNMCRIYKGSCTVMNGDHFSIGTDFSKSVYNALLTGTAALCKAVKFCNTKTISRFAYFFFVLTAADYNYISNTFAFLKSSKSTAYNVGFSKGKQYFIYALHTA